MTSSEQTVPREAGPGGTAAAAYDGLFIAFEGGDGAGKSTQVRLLARGAERLRTHGRRDPPAGRHRRSGGRSATSSCTATTSRRGPRRCCSPPTRPTTSTQLVRPALERGERRLTDRYTRLLGRLPGRRARPRSRRGRATCSMWAVDGLRARPHRGRSTSRRRPGATRRGDVHDRLESEADAFHERGPPALPRPGRAATPSATSSSTADRSRRARSTPRFASGVAALACWGARRERLGRRHRPGERRRDARSGP